MQSFDMIAIVVVVLTLVFAGVHIAIALGITALLGIYLMLGDIEIVRTFVANTAYEALRREVSALIEQELEPLFPSAGARSPAASKRRAGLRARWLPVEYSLRWSFRTSQFRAGHWRAS
jgi:hypothetical protein